MKTTAVKRSILLFSFFLFPFIIFSQVEGLIGYYAFNGSAVDSSVYEHHGAVINAVLTEDLLGAPDKAYAFNGTNSYVTAGNANTLKIDTAFTISVWFRATGAGSPNAGGILVNKEGEYSFARFADGSIRYALAFNNSWTVHVNTNVVVPLNEDTHAVLTYSQSEGQVKLYINCELVYTEDENDVIGDVVPDMNEMRIGGRTFLDQFFEGTIDEVKVFRRALTIDEINTNCVLTSIHEEYEESQTNITVYPNPSPGHFYMEGDLSKVKQLKIFNINGQKIKEVNTGFENVSIQGMTPGLYFIAMYDENGKLLLTKRIVKALNKA